MEIERTNTNKENETNKNKVLLDVSKRIVSIFRNDSLFENKNKLVEINTKLNKLKQENNKKENLMLKFRSIKSNMQNKINSIDEEITTIRSKLLEELGSEL